jgi:hypothetical protein
MQDSESPGSKSIAVADICKAVPSAKVAEIGASIVGARFPLTAEARSAGVAEMAASLGSAAA